LVGLLQSRFQDAWTDFDAAVRAGSTNQHSLFGRGIAALCLGRADNGHADIARAAGLDPAVAATYAGYGISP
jgi:hypothetical protein